MIQFGIKRTHISYYDRPGAYAIIPDTFRRIAVVVLGNKWYLPGGGIENGETEEDALVREVREETGLEIVAWKKCGQARQYVETAKGARGINKICTFYKAEIDEVRVPVNGKNIMWMPLSEAIGNLELESERWILSVTMGIPALGGCSDSGADECHATESG